MTNFKIAILGTGAWATALGCCLSKNNYEVHMWGIDKKEVNDINSGFNKKYFGEAKLFSSLSATIDFYDAIKNSKVILIAVPSNAIEDVVKKLKPHFNKKTNYLLINTSKGLNDKTCTVWTQTIKHIFKGYQVDCCTLSGPSFALDVFNQQPTIVNLITRKQKVYTDVKSMFDNDFFKVTWLKDDKGAQIFSSLKNLLAIGIGIVDKHYNSNNTNAAFITKGINEIQTIVKIMRGNSKTVLSYCGIGDVFLTCSSTKSRNFSFGQQVYELGIEKTLKMNKSTVEGYKNYGMVEFIINKYELNLPLFSTLIKVLKNELEPQNFVSEVFKQI